MQNLILSLLCFVQNPANPPPPAVVTLPANTAFSVALVHPISSREAKIGQQVLFTLAEDILATDTTVLVKKGQPIDGVVTDVEKPDFTHRFGLIAFQLTTLHVGNSGIPVQVQATDKVHHDFRTRKSCGPPQAKPAEVAQFYTQSLGVQDVADQAMSAAGLPTRKAPKGGAAGGGSTAGGSAGNGASSAASATVISDPFAESSAVMLSQILDFNKSKQLLGSYSNTNLWHVVDALVTGKNLKEYTSRFSADSAVSLVGAGFGLWKVAQLGAGFYQQVQLNPGAIFQGVIPGDSKVPVLDSTRRAFAHHHPKVRRPHLSSTQNVVYDFKGNHPYRTIAVQGRA